MELNYYIDILKNIAEEDYRKFNEKITNSCVPSMGVRLPAIRAIAKQYAYDFVDLVSFTPHVYYELDMLQGIVVSSAKLPFEEKSVYLAKFADTLENWAVCDSSKVNVPKAEREKYFKFFAEMCKAQKTFTIRYGITNLMDNFLDEQHIDAVLQLLMQVNYGEYYVDMAVAWLLATAFAKCRESTKAFLTGQGKKLPVFVYNKALQKMRESFRILPEDKQWTYTVKR